MKVRFDLRPAEMVEKERKKKGFNLTRITAIMLMGAFFVTSAGYAIVMTMRLFKLQAEAAAMENAVVVLDAENTALRRQVDELRAMEKVFADALEIMNDDLPAVEVLCALESNMDEYGTRLGSLKFLTGRATGSAGEPDVAEVTGMAASDKQIIDYSDRLRESGVFNDVFLPVTTLDENTGMISFTLRMPVKPIGAISRP